MRLLIKNNLIIGTATDDYCGSELSISAPEDFDISKVKDYRIVDSAAVIPAKTVEEIWTQIKAIRDLKVQTGGYTVDGKWYHSDTFSRTQQMGLFIMGASVPSVQWKTMDDTFVTMTQTLAGQIFAAAATQDQAMFTRAEILHAEVIAAGDPATVNITTGWPEVYTGV